MHTQEEVGQVRNSPFFADLQKKAKSSAYECDGGREEVERRESERPQ